MLPFFQLRGSVSNQRPYSKTGSPQEEGASTESVASFADPKRSRQERTGNPHMDKSQKKEAGSARSLPLWNEENRIRETNTSRINVPEEEHRLL